MSPILLVIRHDKHLLEVLTWPNVTGIDVCAIHLERVLLHERGLARRRLCFALGPDILDHQVFLVPRALLKQQAILSLWSRYPRDALLLGIEAASKDVVHCNLLPGALSRGSERVVWPRRSMLVAPAHQEEDERKCPSCYTGCSYNPQPPSCLLVYGKRGLVSPILDVERLARLACVVVIICVLLPTIRMQRAVDAWIVDMFENERRGRDRGYGSFGAIF